VKAQGKPVFTTWVLVTLGVLGMMGPFGTDTYTPALPAMARDLRISMGLAQATLAAFTIGMAVGQFVSGSLSDRVGRRIIIVGGGAMMTVAAALAAFATNISVLLALCLVMGLSAAGGLTGGRALVADLVPGERAAKPFATLGMVTSIGPILGPIGGALLLTAFGSWRAIFVGLAIFAAIATIGVFIAVPESLPRADRHPGGLAQVFSNAGRILRNRQYITHALILWLSFGLMFAYISSYSFIVQEKLNLTAGDFAASFAVNGTGLIITSFITSRIVDRAGPKRMLTIGVITQLSAMVALLVTFFGGFVSAPLIMVEMFFLVIAMGFVFGPVTALAMMEVRFAAGTAVALLGSIQFASASVSAFLVGVVSNDALVSFIAIAGTAALFVLGALLISRARPATSRNQ